jgi:adenylylsulfate kinase
LTNIKLNLSYILKAEREIKNGFSAKVIWFTGLSASGKSSVANKLELEFFKHGIAVFALDGDNLRHGLSSDLGFSPRDRHENLRRAGEVCKLFLESGTFVLASFISPLKTDRAMLKEIIGEKNFIEIFCSAPLDVCKARDPKGLYKKALNGEILNFTGVGAPYENPDSADLVLDTQNNNIDMCANNVLEFLFKKKIIPPFLS